MSASFYILALISLNNALSLSISVSFAGQVIPSPSSELGFGICDLSAFTLVRRLLGISYHVKVYLGADISKQ